jgi:hypothetical protein
MTKVVLANRVCEERNPSYSSIGERSLAALGMTVMLSIGEMQ